jgi:tetratricopeptide (TPR) repeat protein
LNLLFLRSLILESVLLASASLLDQGKTEFKAGHYQAAARLFEQASGQPKACEALFYLGLTRYQLKQLDPALISFQSAIQCDPRFTPARIALAEGYAQKQNFDEALTAYQQALDVEPANVAALQGAASILLNQEKNDSAIPLLEKLVQLNDIDVQAHTDLGAAYAATGSRDKAKEQFKVALKQDSRSASALTGLANLAIKDGDDAQAITLLGQVVSLAPTAFEPHYLLGSAYSRLARYDQAVSEFQAALRLGGEQPEIYYQLARTLGALGRTEDRQRALTRFAELSRAAKEDAHTSAEVIRLIQESKSLIDAGDLNAAAARMEEARKMRPSDDKILFRLAGLEYDLQKNDLARDYAQEAISIAPSEWVYHFLLGLIEKKSGRLQQAESSLKTALQLNAVAAPVYNAVGELALQENDPRRAVVNFRRAQELDPQEALYKSNLASARAALKPNEPK